MPDLTTRYGMTKDLGTENYSVARVNANTDKLDQQEVIHRITAGGSGDAITATVTNLLVYYEGLGFNFEVTAANTGAVTININGLGAKSLERIVDQAPVALVEDDLKVGDQILAVYDLSLDKVIIQISTNERFSRDERISSSFKANPNDYVINTKQIENFQDETVFVAGGSIITADTTNVKLNTQSLRVEETDNVASSVLALRDNISPPIDLTNLSSGEISGDNDYIVVPVYISDVTFVVNVKIQLGSDLVFGANYFNEQVNQLSLVTGWNVLKLKKVNFDAIGAPDWGNIQSLRVLWTSSVNAAGVYVSFQNIQLVKKDPVSDEPNPFQENGIVDFTINAGEWYVGPEVGKNVIKSIDGLSSSIALQYKKSYIDCIASLTAEAGPLADIPGITLGTSEADYVGLDLLDNSFRLLQNNALLESMVVPATIPGDIIELLFEKEGANIKGTMYINNDYSNPYTLTSTTIITDAKPFNVRSLTSRDGVKIRSVSITEIAHAHHADVAEVAKSLTEQPRARIYNVPATSIPSSSTSTILSFDTVRWDNRNHFDVSDPTKLVIRESGLYSIIATLDYDLNINSYRDTTLLLNGATTIETDIREPSTAKPTTLRIVSQYELKAGDYLQFRTKQESGIAINVFSPEFMIAKIG